MSKYRRFKGNIAFVMVLVLIFTSLPISAFAQGNSIRVQEETEIPDTETDNYFESAASTEKDAPQSLETSSSSTRTTGAISSGVYAIRIKNTTSYARCNTASGGTYLSQQTFSSPPASESYRYAMFKIIYRSSTDDYVIRNMVNNEIVIYANVGYNAPLSERLQNKNDSNVPTESAWNITPTSDGFYNISCTLNSTTYYMYMPTSGNLELTTNGSLDGAKWSFVSYTGADFRGWGQVDDWPEHIANGETAQIEAYIYSTVIGENRAWLMSETNSDIANTVRSVSYSAQMTITPNYGGNTRIRIEANTGSEVFGYYYLTAGWDTGCFFLQNQHSSDFLAVPNESSGSNITLTGLPNGLNKEFTLWQFVHYGNGYYWINQDITGDTIHGNNDTSSNLTAQPYADDAYIQNLWRFVPQSDGTFKIQSKYHAINNPDCYMSLNNVLTKNVRSLADTGDKQLWDIKPLKLNLQILFDQAFIDRHSGVGHLSVLEHVFGENSIDYSIPEALFDQVGVRLEIEYISTSDNPFLSHPYTEGCLASSSAYKDSYCLNHYSNSSSYNCTTTGQTTEVADCNNGRHHKKWDIFDRNLPISSTYVPILFTGHKGCGVSTDSITNESTHGKGGVSGYASDGSSIVILGQGDLSNVGDGSARLVLHEIAHILGAEHDLAEYDVWGSEDYDPSKAYRVDCTMGSRRMFSPAQENLTICSHCQSVIDSYKYHFYNH